MVDDKSIEEDIWRIGKQKESRERNNLEKSIIQVKNINCILGGQGR